MSILAAAGVVAAYERPLVLFENLFQAGGVTASATVASTDPLNVLTDDTFSGWSPSGAASGWLAATFAGNPLVNCVGLAAHNLGAVGASIVVHRWDSTAGAWVTLVPSMAVSSNAPLLILFAAGTRLDGLRVYVNFPAGGPKPFIGIVRVGNTLEFPTDLAAPYVPAHLAGRVELDQPVSAAGAFFAGRVRRLGGAMSPTLNPVPRPWVDAVLPEFRAHYDAGRPFFWAGGPAAMPDDVAFARRAKQAAEMRPSYRVGGAWCDVTLELDTHGA